MEPGKALKGVREWPGQLGRPRGCEDEFGENFEEPVVSDEDTDGEGDGDANEESSDADSDSLDPSNFLDSDAE